jgi:lipopolysaccharide transport system permease protein
MKVGSFAYPLRGRRAGDDDHGGGLLMPRMTHVLESHWRMRRVFVISSKVELQKRYAGSLLGPAWALLYPVVFLSVYVFMWVVVLRVRLPEAGRLDYAVFVLAGLVPYLFFVESLSASVVSIRQNLHLVKGVMLPVELIPTRAVIVAGAGHLVGVALVIMLSVWAHTLSAKVVLLPLVMALTTMALFGLAWVVAPLGLLIPDATYLVNLVTTIFMFVTPIAFTPEMVPARFRAVVWLNPLTYMIQAYRAVLIDRVPLGLLPFGVFAAGVVGLFLVGAALCARYKDVVVDFE